MRFEPHDVLPDSMGQGAAEGALESEESQALDAVKRPASTGYVRIALAVVFSL